MCYEFELEYYRRQEEERRAREAERQRHEGKPVPAKPAEADTPGREQGEPVPV